MAVPPYPLCGFTRSAVGRLLDEQVEDDRACDLHPDQGFVVLSLAQMAEHRLVARIASRGLVHRRDRTAGRRLRNACSGGDSVEPGGIGTTATLRAMQKVVGSRPSIRFARGPVRGLFLTAAPSPTEKASVLRRWLTVCVVLAALALAPASTAARDTAACTPSAGSTLSVLDCSASPVVASLDARYASGEPRFRLASTGVTIPRCRTSEFVFYAARDWLRLAPKLAEHASACADYYVSIPPLVSDKTNPRPNQAWRIRALGPRFHAMAEIHWTTWQSWARANGRTMFDAGVEARRRMVAAGYDVGKGDTWALNEFPSSVRRNLGTARADARDFVRGLYEGDGQPVPGAVFVVGVMHGTSDASVYKSTLKAWLGDAPFWVDMQRYVRFWAQEVYGDARRWGVPGADPVARRDYLNEFLQHSARLGAAAPGEHAAARAFLSHAHTPIANAGWQWPAGLGWTMVSGDQMRHFVSSQTYALRNFAASKAGPDRFGFAWAPNNAVGMPHQEFVAQTGQLLDRLGSALADSGSEWRLDPGVHACAALGLDWCRADVAGASFTEAWEIFSAWENVLARRVSREYGRLVEQVRGVVSRSSSQS